MEYVRQQPAIRTHVLMSPADISFGADSLVQPDVFVVPVEQARTLEWSGITRLVLAVEILSPSSLRADRFTKRRLYQEWGVECNWIIDADREQAEVWTPDAIAPAIEREALRWHPDGAAAPFTLLLDELFRPI